MNSQPINNIQNDEIDLIELIFSIWRKKWWVILFTVIFSGISIAYSLLAKEVWTSKTEIIPPSISDMGTYLDKYEQYLSISNPNQNNQNISEKVSNTLFDNFLSAAGSYENQLNYFKPNADMKKLAKLLKSVSVEKPNKKKNINYLTMSLKAETANQAQSLLSGLVEHINRTVHDKMLESLDTEIKTKIRTLTIDEESMKVFADTTQQVRLKNLKKALLTAKKAGIKSYSTVSEGQHFIVPNSVSGEAGIKLTDDRLAEDNFLFMLGEDYLQAQIDTLTQTEIVYPERYYQVQLQAKLLTNLLNEKENTQFDTFSFQSSPNKPLQRSAPKRALIVLIGTFLGGVIGLLVALFMAALENRKTKVQAG